MSPAEYIKREKKFYQDVFLKDKAFQIAVYNVVAEQIKRIFEKGLNSNNSQIGEYNSTNDLYVYSKNFKGGGKLKPNRGKPSTLWMNPTNEYPQGERYFTGKTIHRAGKGAKVGDEHRTKWVKSYKDLRNKLGREVNFVNLKMNNDMFLDFTRGLKKISPIQFVLSWSRKLNAEKAEGLESKYKGKIFRTTKEEKKLFLKSLDFNIKKAREDYYNRNQQ